MAIKSMTGYGAAVATAGDDSWRIEIRAVNHRHLDCKLRLPREIAALEPKLREVVAGRVARGHLGVTVTPGDGAEATRTVRLDLPFARRVYEVLSELRGTLGLEGGVRLEHVLGFEGVAAATTRDIDIDATRSGLVAAMGRALDDLDSMRRAEGERLRADLEDRLDAIEALGQDLRRALPEAMGAARVRLRERIGELTEGMAVEWQRDRLEAELALYADKSDVAEELTRLDAHVAAVRELMAAPDGEPCGRKLEFLAIELNRELNTVGSKSSAAAISRLVIDAKAEVERVREQVANVE